MSRSVPARLRALVRDRAARRCEYCLPHENDVLPPHEPDHIRSVKHGGSTILANLAWICMACNRRKGSDQGSWDYLTGRLVRLFNPRRDRWSGHFLLRESLIVPKSAVGRVTEYLLELNRAELVDLRTILMESGLYPHTGLDR